MNKMKTTSSDSKGKSERSGKGLVTALYFKTKVRLSKYKKARYAIGNVSEKDLSKIIKDFEKIGKVPYVKSILKHEPTSSYYRLVICIVECMMRSDEHNRHVHGSYAEDTDLSSNVNVTDEDESKEIIVHETLFENQSMDVSKSKCNIVHENLLQNNSSDVPANVITELKEDEHKEHSVIEKGTRHFNIFECGRNLLDKLDVTYQRALMASPVQEKFYQPSPAREWYYDKMDESLIKAKIGSDRTINNDELHKAITQLKSEKEADHERSIIDMTQVDYYMLPWKDKDATTVNDTAYTFLN